MEQELGIYKINFPRLPFVIDMFLKNSLVVQLDKAYKNETGAWQPQKIRDDMQVLFPSVSKIILILYMMYDMI